MKLSVLLHTSEYRGDHSADVQVAYEVRPRETVEELAKRLLAGQPGDYVAIRVAQELPHGDS